MTAVFSTIKVIVLLVRMHFSLLQVEQGSMCIRQDLRHELVSSCLKRLHKQTSRTPETNYKLVLRKQNINATATAVALSCYKFLLYLYYTFFIVREQLGRCGRIKQINTRFVAYRAHTRRCAFHIFDKRHRMMYF